MFKKINQSKISLLVLTAVFVVVVSVLCAHFVGKEVRMKHHDKQTFKDNIIVASAGTS